MGNDIGVQEIAAELGSSANLPVKRIWYRRVFFQATIVGFCAFLAPGLYNAMQSTGAGGAQTPYLVMLEYSNCPWTHRLLTTLKQGCECSSRSYDGHHLFSWKCGCEQDRFKECVDLWHYGLVSTHFEPGILKARTNSLSKAVSTLQLCIPIIATGQSGLSISELPLAVSLLVFSGPQKVPS